MTDNLEFSNKLSKIYRSSLCFSFITDRQNMTNLVENKTNLIKLCVIDGCFLGDKELNSVCKYLKKSIDNARLCAIIKRRPSDSERFLRSKLLDTQIFEPFSASGFIDVLKSFIDNENTFRCIKLSVDRKESLLCGYPLSLTPSEHRLLALLVRYPENVFSPSDISTLTFLRNEASVSVHVCTINKKAAIISGRPLILSKYGLGYYINPNP